MVAAGASILTVALTIRSQRRLKAIEAIQSKSLKTHEITFKKLHEERAEVIKQIYRKMWEINKHLRSTNHANQGVMNHWDDTQVKRGIEDLTEYAFINSFFFNSKTNTLIAGGIRDIQQTHALSAKVAALKVDALKRRVLPQTLPGYAEVMSDLDRTDDMRAMTALGEMLRKLLGVEEVD